MGVRIDEVRWSRSSGVLTIVKYEDFEGHQVIEVPLTDPAPLLDASLAAWRGWLAALEDAMPHVPG